MPKKNQLAIHLSYDQPDTILIKLITILCVSGLHENGSIVQATHPLPRTIQFSQARQEL